MYTAVNYVSFPAQGATVAGLVSVGVCMWVAIGGYTIPPQRVVPPGPTWNCSLTADNTTSLLSFLNTTTAPDESPEER